MWHRARMVTKRIGQTDGDSGASSKAFLFASAATNSSHSILLFLRSTNHRNPVLSVPLGERNGYSVSIAFSQEDKKYSEKRKTYSPKRNAKGMLSLFPEAVMIAEETRGPMNAEVLPTYFLSISISKQRGKSRRDTCHRK